MPMDADAAKSVLNEPHTAAQEGVTINFVRMNEIQQNTILIEFISLLFMTPS